MQYYAISQQSKGRYVETLVTKPNAPSMAGQTEVETGVVYKTFRDADKGIWTKNLALSRR